MSKQWIGLRTVIVPVAGDDTIVYELNWQNPQQLYSSLRNPVSTFRYRFRLTRVNVKINPVLNLVQPLLRAKPSAGALCSQLAKGLGSRGLGGGLDKERGFI